MKDFKKMSQKIRNTRERETIRHLKKENPGPKALGMYRHGRSAEPDPTGANRAAMETATQKQRDTMVAAMQASIDRQRALVAKGLAAAVGRQAGASPSAESFFSLPPLAPPPLQETASLTPCSPMSFATRF
jgi:hypothetical protein